MLLETQSLLPFFIRPESVKPFKLFMLLAKALLRGKQDRAQVNPSMAWFMVQAATRAESAIRACAVNHCSPFHSLKASQGTAPKIDSLFVLHSSDDFRTSWIARR